jgi:tRNA pseudouridine13 synthase
MLKTLSYLSKSKGTGGEIKKNPWDFVVSEIDLNGEVYLADKKVESKWTKKEEYVVFVLQKRNWTTSQALREVTRRLGMGKKRFSCAGTKDRRATTTQLASVFGADLDKVMNVKIKDIDILGAWYWDTPVKMGDLLGNRFEIRIPSVEEDGNKVKAVLEETGGLIPNYFGEQRFGIRDNTHIVGKYVLLGRFEDAVVEYLVGGKKLESDGGTAGEIEEMIRNHEFGKALETFPRFLKYERTLLSYLSERSTDYVGALRKLPRNILLMLVHAVQSDIFNQVLTQKVAEKGNGKMEIEEGEYECSRNWYGFPEVDRIDGTFPVGKIIGYLSKPNKREKRILDEGGIKTEDFRVKSIPEISSAGSYRSFLVPIKNFNFEYEKNLFGFELPSGAYATVAMREFLDVKK